MLIINFHGRHWCLGCLLHYANLLSIRVLPWGKFATGLNWNYPSVAWNNRTSDWRGGCLKTYIYSSKWTFRGRKRFLYSWRNAQHHSRGCSLVVRRNVRRHLEQNCTELKMQTGCCCRMPKLTLVMSWSVSICCRRVTGKMREEAILCNVIEYGKQRKKKSLDFVSFSKPQNAVLSLEINYVCDSLMTKFQSIQNCFEKFLDLTASLK